MKKTLKNWRGLWQLPIALSLAFGAPLCLAAQPQTTPAQFDMTGIIETFTLNPAAGGGCPIPQSAITTPVAYNAQVGGIGNRTAMDCTATITINGQAILLPANTVVTLPASFMTPYELFAFNPLCTAACSASGLALNDPAGLRLPGSFEASIQGNIIYPGGVPTMVAGMVKITQEDLNTGDGYITSINYATGEIMVGGNLGAVDGVRVRINDPVGRFGRPTVPNGPLDTFDPRFAVDDGNPTIAAETGYPMCLPAVLTDPAVTGADDPLCPQANRGGAAATVASPQGALIHLGTFTMDCLPALKVGGLCPVPAGGVNVAQPALLAGTNPNLAAPLEVGDFIHYKGNLETDATGTYIAAHTISANIGIYTWPSTDPAYITQETTIVGLGPATGFVGLQEGRELFKVVGFSTDVNRIVDISKVVTDPCNGTETPALIASQWVNGATSPAAPANVAANVPLGRFRTQFLKGANLGVSMIPATKEIRTQIRGSNPVVPPAVNPKTQGNGLVYGSYQAPVGEYIFPENLGFGALPIVPNNMEALQFLALGHGPWNLYDPYGVVFSAGLLADPAPIQSQLAPWPGAVAPAGVSLASCTGAGGATRAAPPIVSISPASVTVARGGAVTLVANASSLNGSNNLTFAWAQTSGADVMGAAVVTNSPAPANPANPWTSSIAFAAPNAAGIVNLTVNVTDNTTGESSGAIPVTVNVINAVDTITATINPPTYKSKDGSWNFGFTSNDVSLTWQPTVQIYNGSNVLVKTFQASELTHTPLSNVYTYTNKLLVGPLGNVPPALPVGMTMVVTSDKGGRLGPIAITQK